MSRYAPGVLEARIGEVIEGRFELRALLGAGRQGAVYRAFDREHEAEVAVKVMHLRCDDPVGRERLNREMRVLETLAADGVARLVASAWSDKGELCLVTALIAGETLDEVMARAEAEGGLLPEETLRLVMRDVARTLERAWMHGFVHRDVKPSNVMVEHDESVKLLDFGYVRALDALSVTAEDIVPGSPAYVAPEATYTAELDGRADVYALGVLCFRALSGRLPFDGRNALVILERALGDPRPSLHALRPDLPEEIDAWVERALAAAPSERFATPTELCDALDFVLSLPREPH